MVTCQGCYAFQFLDTRSQFQVPGYSCAKKLHCNLQDFRTVLELMTLPPGLNIISTSVESITPTRGSGKDHYYSYYRYRRVSSTTAIMTQLQSKQIDNSDDAMISVRIGDSQNENQPQPGGGLLLCFC